jgi:hypothetical protein
MGRIVTISLTLVAAALLIVPSTAGAAKKGPTPSISRVTPMRVQVGSLLTIRGSHFKASRKANTVIFRGPSGRTVFVKPRRAGRTKLVVRIPASVARLLTVKNSRQRPTRLKLRVLAGRFSKFTSRRLSPVVLGTSSTGPGGGGGGGNGGGGGAQRVCPGPDFDGDLLPNSLEADVKTDPCLADTDGDAISDGWEYYAAKDLNIKAVPYPGKRPFPNALDPSDGGDADHQDGWSAYDFDGDGLTTLEEYRAWRFTGSSFDPSKAGGLDRRSPLGYSDGTKYSRADETPAVPAWRGPLYGLPAPTAPFPATYDFRAYDDGVGTWRDDERDADADGLANWLESARGPGRNAWWKGFWQQDDVQVDPWPKKISDDCDQRPGYFDQRPFAELDLADRDVDGDTLLDGEDDQDNDDYTNIVELYELFNLDGDGQAVCFSPIAPFEPAKDEIPTLGGNAVNPFNPCAPNQTSRTCEDYKPFG